MAKHIWIARDPSACSGCRRCELACSMHHEGWMWPEASKVRVFMPFPGLEVPHLCAQCQDYPCVNACPVQALSTDRNGAVTVDREKCISCGACIRACPGTVPYLHPGDNKATICDLYGDVLEQVKMPVDGYTWAYPCGQVLGTSGGLQTVETGSNIAYAFTHEKDEL